MLKNTTACHAQKFRYADLLTCNFINQLDWMKDLILPLKRNKFTLYSCASGLHFCDWELSSCTSALDLLKFIHAEIKQKGCPETSFDELLLLRPQDKVKIWEGVSGLQSFHFSAVCSHNDGHTLWVWARTEELCCKEVWRNHSLA